MPALRPRVSPWSPIWLVAAMATSSMRSGGSEGLRRSRSRMTLTTRSSARVLEYWLPALPNGVRTPSTNTTSRNELLTATGTSNEKTQPGYFPPNVERERCHRVTC